MRLPGFALLALALWPTAAFAADRGISWRSLQIEGVKIEWTMGGRAELPTWISVDLAPAPGGGLAGHAEELGLTADGADEDGDPAGFDMQAFSTADGTLKDVHLDAAGFAFTLVYTGDKAAEVHVVGRAPADPKGEWTLEASVKSGDQPEYGRNRFPLDTEVKDGVLHLFGGGDWGKDNANTL